MRAMILPEFGDPNLFEERDVERPEPGPGEVLVHIFASSVNLVDTKFRADGGSAGLEPPVILGADISGVVEEVGPGVMDLAPGDEACLPLSRGSRCRTSCRWHRLRGDRASTGRAGRRDGPYTRRGGRRGLLRRPDS